MFRCERTADGWRGWDDEVPGCEVFGPKRFRLRLEVERLVEERKAPPSSSSEVAIENVRQHYYSLWRKTADGIAYEVPERLADYVRHWRAQRRWLHKVLGARGLRRALDCCESNAESTLYALLGELSGPEDVRAYAHATHREMATYWAIDEHINEVERLLRSLEIAPTEFVEEDVSPYVLLTQIRLTMYRRAGAFVSSRRPIRIQSIGKSGPAMKSSGAALNGYLACRLDKLLPRDCPERSALIAALMSAAGIPISRQNVNSTLKDRKRKDSL